MCAALRPSVTQRDGKAVLVLRFGRRLGISFRLVSVLNQSNKWKGTHRVVMAPTGFYSEQKVCKDVKETQQLDK